MKFDTNYLINFICHQSTNKFQVQNNNTVILNLHGRIVKIVSNDMEHELKKYFWDLKKYLLLQLHSQQLLVARPQLSYRATLFLTDYGLKQLYGLLRGG